MAVAELAPISTRFTPNDLQEYVVYEAVPIWKEHYSHDANMYLGKAELEKVAAHCNRRAADTGDYPPLCIGHNEKNNDPEVVGYCSGFFVAQFGKLKPKWTIFASWHVFKSDVYRIKKYPRVSVEYWFTEKDPGGGYFDPVSLLGAQTPELDMGSRIQYARDPDRTGLRRAVYSRVVKYAADPTPTAPAGGNTYVPGDDSKNRSDYAKDGSMSSSFSAEQQSELMAIMAGVVKNAVAEAMAMTNPIAPTGSEPDGPTFGAETDEAAAAEAEAGEQGAVADPADGDVPPDVAADADANAGDAPADAAADNETAEGDAADSDESPDDEAEEDTADADGTTFSEDGDEMKKMAKYQADADRDGAIRYLADLPEYTQRAIRNCYQRYNADDSRSTFFKSLDGTSSESGNAQAAATGTTANVESGDPAGVASGTPDNDRLQVAKYQREAEEFRSKYQKEFREHSELKAKYQKLEAQANESKKEALKVSRYQKLSEVAAEGYVVDPKDEMLDCESMTDAQFDRHVDKIRAKYAKVPLGQLPSEREQTRPTSGGEEDIKKRTSYSKQARQIVEERRGKGEKNVDFVKVLEEVKAAGRHNGAAVVG